ncbi:MAG: PAS domain S-box protein [Rhodospirillaceae bacterium]|jgi:PAS domain S-box-containing protein|nr:PAS domain S-box protein [Rhodospirillaceae bacterium]MBT5048786.1 PAS domain S-box protein [Rhodospirillaceae bacterium]MBT6430877.1 PAS domain S-box protein [Rhodospirillaceae bacterium]
MASPDLYELASQIKSLRSEVGITERSVRERDRLIDVLMEKAQRLETPRDSDNHFRELVESSLQGVSILDQSQRYFANRAYVEMLGYDSVEELMEKVVAIDVFPPYERDRVRERLGQRLTSGGQAEPFEADMVRRDGSIVTALIMGRRIEWHGKPAILSTFVDVTERTQAEEALKRSEERLRALIENALDTITIVGTDGTILFESPSVERVLGYKPEELVGRKVFDFLHSDDVQAAIEALLRAPETPARVREIVLRTRHKDGSWRHLQAIGRNLSNNPSVGGIVLNSRDITERVAAETQLRSERDLFARQVTIMTDLATRNLFELGLQAAYRTITEQASAALLVERVSVWLYGASGDEVECVDLYVKSTGNHASGERLNRSREVFEREIEERIIAIDDVATDERAADLRSQVYEPRGIGAILDASIWSEGACLGWLTLCHVGGTREWSVAEQGIAIALASYCARIVENEERRKTEQALRESELNFRSIAEGSPVPLLITRLTDGIILYANPSVGPVLGLAIEALVGRNVADFVWHRYEREDRMARFEANGFISDEVLEMRRADGEHISTVHSLQSINYAGERALLGSFQDVTESKKAEQALRESQRNLAEAQRIGHIGHWRVNTTSGLADWSPEMHEIWGLVPSDTPVTLDTILNAIHPDDISDVVAARDTAVAENQPYGLEFRIVRSNGEIRHVRNEGRPEFDAEHNLVSVFGISQDITERKKAENALRQSEARFRDYAEAASDWFWEFDAERRFTYVSDRFYEITGGSPGGVVGKTAAEQHQIYETPESGIGIDVAIANRLPFRDIVSSRILDNGRKCWIRSGGIPIFEGDGSLVGYRGVSTDITEEVEARGAAEQADRRFFNSLDNMPDHVCLYDSEDCLVYSNGVARQHRISLYGRDFLGETFEAFCRATITHGHVPEAEGREEQWLRERIQQHRQPRAAFRVHGRGETDYWHEIREHRTPDGGTLVTWVNITESVVQEQQLRQAQKMEAVGQLTGGVAHDFNNVLAIIQGNLELLHRKLGDDDVVDSHLKPALRATDRGAALTHRLLAFARKQTLDVQDVDIGALLLGMDDMLRRTLGETIDIKVDNAATPWLCAIDPGQLEQAVLNLAVNARDAMPNGGRLTIETSNAQIDESYAAENLEVEPGEYVILAVSDSGTGMSRDVQAQIFDPFFTTKEVGKGTGLGLSMVFGFVKQSGGHVAVYSELGQGTTFRLYLPRSRAAAASPLTTVAPETAMGKPGETILAVEDDAGLRELIEDMLQDLGYAVIVAGTGRLALDILSTTPRVDLLLTDVVLPGGVSGPELAQAALRERADLKVLYMSGYTQDAIARHGRLDPDLELLTKPFTLKDFGRKLREVLDG